MHKDIGHRQAGNLFLYSGSEEINKMIKTNVIIVLSCLWAVSAFADEAAPKAPVAAYAFDCHFASKREGSCFAKGSFILLPIGASGVAKPEARIDEIKIRCSRGFEYEDEINRVYYEFPSPDVTLYSSRPGASVALELDRFLPGESDNYAAELSVGIITTPPFKTFTLKGACDVDRIPVPIL